MTKPRRSTEAERERAARLLEDTAQQRAEVAAEMEQHRPCPEPQRPVPRDPKQ